MKPTFRVPLISSGALLCLMPGVTTAAVSGEQIYRQKCADCHGKNAQGVEGKGKYAGALYGDWALPKLTRYIAAN